MQTVEVRLVRPSGLALAGAGSLAVAAVSAPEEHAESARGLTAALHAALQRHGRLRIVPPERTRDALARTGLSASEILAAPEAARLRGALDADALVLVELRSAETVRATTSEDRERRVWSHDEVVARRTSGGGVAYQRVPVYRQVREEVPVEVYTAQVHLLLRVLRLSDGALLAAETISRGSDRPLRRPRGEAAPPPDTQGMLADVLAKTAEELARMLSPHRQTTRRRLLRGSGDVARGVALAADGDWDGAARLWEASRAARPQDAGALHNLAIAAERVGDFESAVALLREAVRAAPSEGEHAAALSEVERELREAEAAVP